MRIRVPLCAVLFALAAVPALAAEWTPARAFRTFNKAQWRGLPQSSVVALAQSSDGVLWIGTLDGVATFDGKSITPVPDVKGAPLRGLIPGIVARRKGGVYAGSQYGVHVFDGSNWRLIETERGVSSIAEARNGVLWIVDGDGKVWTVRGEEGVPRQEELPVPAVAVTAAHDGAVWIATDDGAMRIADGRIEPVIGSPLPSRPGAILAASDGMVWVATQSCTVHWSRGGSDGWHQAAFEPWTRGGAFRTLAEDRRGRIWAGSLGGQVAFGNATTPWTVWGPANGTPFEFGVMSILGDREGTIWFGLNSAGLAQWVGEAWSHRISVDPSSTSRRIQFGGFGISRSEFTGDLLVGAFAAGALRLRRDGSTRQYSAADGLTEDVRAVVEPAPGTLYAGTRYGVFESQDGKPFRQTLKLDRGFVMGLFRSPGGRWYATSNTDGVFVREAGGWRSDKAINSHLDNQHVRAMLWRRNGELWVATLRGINVYHDGRLAGRINSQTIPAIPESVNALLEISDDEIWAAGTGGLAVLRGGRWRGMKPEADGLPGQTIYSLALGRDGAVWAGGSAGVGRYLNGRWTVWDSRSGLLLEECNLNGLLVYDDGSVYVGTLGGMARFDPSVAPLPAPKLQLRWVERPGGTLQDRALHLRWSAPWLDPRPVQYRVRIPRLREGWSAPTYDDHIDIENLGHGRWRVEVAARVEGTTLWNEPLTLDVEVPPYWYETVPARAAIAGLLALLVYAAVRLRLRALRRHAANLEATVRTRTAELAEKVEQLRESEQRALTASRAKSAFLANMSHELRTPLNGILGFAQLLARRNDRDAEIREGLGVIMSSGEHLLGLINDVLSLAKIEAGGVTLEKIRFDLRKVVRDVEKVLRLRADEKRIRFTVEMDESQLPPAVTGDEVRLRQILLNLVGNAVKFTEKGEVTLRARWTGGRAIFEVQDTGPGIAAEELPRLFEPFVQTESGRRSKEGTGLGLAVSQNLARLMDGQITVDSAAGRGSTFRVEVALPVAEAAVAGIDERRVKALAPGQPPVRILVADDTPVNRTVLTRLLSQVGFQVREAANGEDAVLQWRAWKPHLIWMDWRMSGMDGLEATRRIRAEEKSGRERTPIIALSASALDHERGQILAAGCDDFVAKPFRESVIFARIRDFLGVEYVYEEPLAPALPSPTVVRDGETARVLLVDDDWVCREVASEALRVNGVGVTAASSGKEALELLATDRFDLVLMDLQMPDMSGVEAARRIKADPATARLPVIAMSADTFDGEPGRLAQTGMDAYVGKPVQPDVLTGVVARFLSKRSAIAQD